jgi:hypothetical protein
MIMAQEQAILKAQEQFAQIQDFLRQACVAGRPIDQVELDLWGRMLQLGRQLLEGYVAGYRQGDLGPTLTQDGRVLRRLEQPHVRRYVSIFGPLEISRYVYGTRETQKHEVIPLDALLALPDSEFSYVLQDWDQSLCVQNSYGQSQGTIQRILRLGQSVLSLEQMNGQMAAAVEPFWAQHSEVAEPEGPILVVTADGKGVPMRRQDGGTKPVRRNVKDRVKPASRIGFKTSHFEELTVCHKNLSKSMMLRFREVRHGKPTQDGCSAFNTDAPGAGLVSAADRQEAGNRSRDGRPVRPFAAGRSKTSHEPDPRVGSCRRGDCRGKTGQQPDPRA